MQLRGLRVHGACVYVYVCDGAPEAGAAAEVADVCLGLAVLLPLLGVVRRQQLQRRVPVRLAHGTESARVCVLLRGISESRATARTDLPGGRALTHRLKYAAAVVAVAAELLAAVQLRQQATEIGEKGGEVK